jgi:hypothetical protein
VSSTDAFVSISGPDEELQRKYLRLYRKAEARGLDVGRNILLEGEKAGDGVRAATRAEIVESIGVLKRMLAPAPAAGTTTVATGGGGSLEAIAACESGGDPAAVGGGGAYRGKYQFTHETWQSVGGTGDPAAASEAEQDQRAAMLLARDGAGHWPTCAG